MREMARHLDGTHKPWRRGRRNPEFKSTFNRHLGDDNLVVEDWEAKARIEREEMSWMYLAFTFGTQSD